MDRPTIELHETVIRLAKGIVSARERYGRSSGTQSPIAAVLDASPLAGLLKAPTSELKATIGVWENWLKLESR